MRTGQGTGEYGILVNSLDDYHKIVTLQFARAVVKIIAMRHGITLPKVIGWKAHSKHWGQYSQLDNTIRLTKPISFGVVIHEGCHAVILQKYPYAPAHRSEFKSLLASEFRHFDL